MLDRRAKSLALYPTWNQTIAFNLSRTCCTFHDFHWSIWCWSPNTRRVSQNHQTMGAGLWSSNRKTKKAASLIGHKGTWDRREALKQRITDYANYLPSWCVSTIAKLIKSHIFSNHQLHRICLFKLCLLIFFRHIFCLQPLNWVCPRSRRSKCRICQQILSGQNVSIQDEFQHCATVLKSRLLSQTHDNHYLQTDGTENMPQYMTMPLCKTCLKPSH